MKRHTYLIEKSSTFFFLLFLFALSGIYLFLTGTDLSILLLLFCVYALAFSFYFYMDYRKIKEKCQKIDALLENLEKPYLLAELMEKPEDTIDKKYYEMLRKSMKSCLEKIKEVEKERREYKEYIEEWVHEIKTPIASVSLICENHSFLKKKEIVKELFKLEKLVEQVLYYARSEQTEKDYVIKEEVLEELVHQSLLKYRSLILEKKIEVVTENLDIEVYTDPKWMIFILNQMIGNAIKYMDKEKRSLTIQSIKEKEEILLCIEDNGSGIPGSALPRVFEKGFTGVDRRNQNATGMGLYLSKKLCDKLGHSIHIESKEEIGTKVYLSFPIGNLHKL